MERMTTNGVADEKHHAQVENRCGKDGSSRFPQLPDIEFKPQREHQKNDAKRMG